MGKKFMLLRGLGVTLGYFMFMLLSEAAIPTVGVPLYAKTPLIGSLPHLGRLIQGNRLGRVLFPGNMVTPDVMAAVPVAMRLLLWGSFPCTVGSSSETVNLHHHVDAEYVGVVVQGSRCHECDGRSLGLSDHDFSWSHPSDPRSDGDLSFVLLLSD